MSVHLDETTGMQTVEVTCQRSVSGSNFPAGVQDFNWTIARPNVWSPADSYFVVEVEVLGPGDPTTATQPKVSDMLALAENAGNSLYTNAYFHCGGQVVSSVTQYHAQLGALSARMGNTAAWSRSIGEGAYNDMASFSERVAALSVSDKLKVNGGTNHPLGISLVHGKLEIYKNTTAGNFATANLAVDAAGIVTGVGSNFANTDIGNFLYIEGEKLQIIDWTNAQTITVQAPSVTIAGTTAWYVVRRNSTRTTQGHNKLQIIFRPPLGIFGSNVLMGPGSYKISLSPDSNYRFAAIETVNEDAKGLTPGVGANSPYTVNILDVKFYATTAQKLLPEGAQPALHLMEYQAFSRTMNGTQGSFNFTVPVSTEELFVFLQHPSAGTNPVFPPSKFVAANSSDLNLAAIQVTYAGQTKPQTRWESGFKDSDPAGRNKSYLTHLYYQQLIESSRCCDQEGGVESLDEWLQRGPVFTFRFDKDATSRETEVNLQISYNEPMAGVGFATDSKIFVVARYRTVRQLTVSDGAIVSVVGLEA